MKSLKYMVALIIITSCSKNTVDTSSLYVPAGSDATSTASLVDLQNGRKLYINNCSSCHNLYPAESFLPNEWKMIVTQMSINTSMTAAQTNLVLKYLCKGNQ